MATVGNAARGSIGGEIMEYLITLFITFMIAVAIGWGSDSRVKLMIELWGVMVVFDATSSIIEHFIWPV